MKHLAVFLLPALLLAPASAASSQVRVEKDDRDRWRLLVDGQPFLIRGMDYRVSRIGESPDEGSLTDWMEHDGDGNGRPDGPYDAWVDSNGNGRRDADEPAEGDFELLRQAGVNTIRWYVNDFKEQQPHKEVLRDLFARYGVRVAVGNKFGAYTIDSGASWEEGTDYRDPAQQERLLESVRRMVLEHKDEPYTLVWLLGNENNLRFTNTNAGQFPDDYANLLNRAAALIRELDGKHPVALVNGDTRNLPSYRKHAPAVDIFGVNAYRGPKGFGSLWKEVKAGWGKPVLVTEYGGSYAASPDEDVQEAYHLGCWRDIEANAAEASAGSGNALGGFAFEWLDEWWKAGDPRFQADPGSVGKQGKTAASWTQEHCGVMGQGDGSQSPFLRRPRKAYRMYRRIWGPRTVVEFDGPAAGS